MAKAVTCPICGGEGTIPTTDYGNYATGFPSRKTCHGCGGKGWVEVADK